MANQDNRDINIYAYEEDPFSFTLNDNTIEARIVAVKSRGGCDVWVDGSGVDAVKTISATDASGDYSVAEGYATVASGDYSHVEGYGSVSEGDISHAEGFGNSVSGDYGTHGEGYYTQTTGDYGAHAEGYYTVASGLSSHAEGMYSMAHNHYTHAEGYNTYAGVDPTGNNYDGVDAEGAHAEGYETYADGDYGSHAEGYGTYAHGVASHAGGYCTDANCKAMTAIGRYNKIATLNADEWVSGRQYAVGDLITYRGYTYKCASANSSTTFNYSQWFVTNTLDGDTAFVVGNGTGMDSRSNAMRVDWYGNTEIGGSITLGAGTNDEVTITAAQLRALLALIQ